MLLCCHEHPDPFNNVLLPTYRLVRTSIFIPSPRYSTSSVVTFVVQRSRLMSLVLQMPLKYPRPLTPRSLIIIGVAGTYIAGRQKNAYEMFQILVQWQQSDTYTVIYYIYFVIQHFNLHLFILFGRP